MHRYTQSADVWAFGIIVLELASGHVPRKGMGFRSLVMQTVHGEVPYSGGCRDQARLLKGCPLALQCASGLDASSSTLADTLRPETGQCMLACEHMSCMREYCRSNVETHTCVSGVFSLLPIRASLTRCRRAFVMRSVPVMLE